MGMPRVCLRVLKTALRVLTLSMSHRPRSHRQKGCKKKSLMEHMTKATMRAQLKDTLLAMRLDNMDCPLLKSYLLSIASQVENAYMNSRHSFACFRDTA